MISCMQVCNKTARLCGAPRIRIHMSAKLDLHMPILQCGPVVRLLKKPGFIKDNGNGTEK